MRRILFLLVLLAFVGGASALKLPSEYNVDECELIMKDYQAVYGGNFVLIVPTDYSGNLILGTNGGHWLNKAYSKERGGYFIDYMSGTYFNNTAEVEYWFWDWKLQHGKAFDFSIARPEFSIRWQY